MYSVTLKRKIYSN
uniref:Uncharacterized protein n=1 Tax=Rhizophora mucronata TaxID=61149 RepID=A0A2P2ND98_RHIMU